MTNQEMFDKAWNGLKSQGWLKCWKEGRCVYNGDNGKHCAVGWIVDVPDRLNGTTISGLIGEGLVKYTDYSFLSDLQTQHDMSVDPVDMKTRIADFAKAWDLVIPE